MEVRQAKLGMDYDHMGTVPAVRSHGDCPRCPFFAQVGRRRRPLSTGPGWRRAIPARLAYFDFFADSPLTFAEKVSIARAELVEAITARTGRRTVAKPGRSG